MPGESDLASMLASLTVTRRPGVYTVVSLDPATNPATDPAFHRASDTVSTLSDLTPRAEVVITEAEGVTLVLRVEHAHDAGLPVDFEAAWLTLDVHSSLEAVGLTAAVSVALADCGIACNVIAGYFHDHLLVPVHRLDEATAALTQLRLSHP